MVGETKVSLIFPNVSRQPNSELYTKQLIFFLVLRDRVDIEGTQSSVHVAMALSNLLAKAMNLK